MFSIGSFMGSSSISFWDSDPKIPFNNKNIIEINAAGKTRLKNITEYLRVNIYKKIKI